MSDAQNQEIDNMTTAPAWERLREEISGTIAFCLRRPWAKAAAVSLLGLSLAIVLAVSSIVERLVFGLPPGINPETVGFVYSTVPEGLVSYPAYRDIKERVSQLGPVEAFGSVQTATSINRNKYASLTYQPVSGGYFRLLAVTPQAGRLLDDGDDVLNSTPVAVVRAAAARQAGVGVGEMLPLNGRRFLVVGIVADEIEPLVPGEEPEVWIPLSQVTIARGPRVFVNRSVQWLTVVGRLTAPAAHASAHAEIDLVGRALSGEFAATDRGIALRLVQIAQFRMLRVPAITIASVILGITWLLFFLVCTVFLGLIAIHALSKSREVALRLILGGARAQIARFVMFEAFGMACLALAIGYLGAQGMLLFGPRLVDLGLGSFGNELRVEWRSITAALIALLLLLPASIGLVCSIYPKSEKWSFLKESSHATNWKGSLQFVFVGQIAIAIALTYIAVECTSTIIARMAQPPRFDSGRTAFAYFDFRALGRASSQEDLAAAIAGLREGFMRLPNVAAVSATTSLPLETPSWTNIVIDERPDLAGEDRTFSNYAVVAGDYFATLRIPMVAGRDIALADIRAGAEVAVVSESAARKFWPSQDPMGASFRPWSDGPRLVIIGIVADLPISPGMAPPPMVYVPISQAPDAQFRICVRLDTPGTLSQRQVQDAVAAVWPFETPVTMWTGEEHLARSNSRLRAASRLALPGGAGALAMYAVGFWALSAFMVRQNLKTLAIKVSLGGGIADLCRSELRYYGTAFMIGSAAGICLIWGLVRHTPILESTSVNGLSLTITVSLLALIGAAGIGLPLSGIYRAPLFPLLRGPA